MNGVIHLKAINLKGFERNNSSLSFNADLKICQYLLLHMKMIYWKIHIETPFTFWDMRPWDMRKVCL